jgi:ribosome maturation factor RimP
LHEPEVGARPPFSTRGWDELEAEALIRPVVDGAGFELVEVVFRRESGRQILRVTVDHEDGVDLDAISALSEKVSRRLDLEDFGRGRYELEVSSPGIERPLRAPAQFRRVVGSQVKVKTAEPVDGARVHVGTLVAAGDETVVIDVNGRERRIALGGISSARTVVDWDAELKGSRA